MSEESKVESIILVTAKPDMTGWRQPPYGYYHIIKCYNWEHRDMWTIAHLSIGDFSWSEAVDIARAMAYKFNCPLKEKGRE